MKRFFILLTVFLLVFAQTAFAEPMYSPTWRFFVDLPEGYEFTDGDGKDQFSFSGPGGLIFDMIVYNGKFKTMLDMVEDINRKITNKGSVDFFTYNGRQAAVIELLFSDQSGWGFAVELENFGGQTPMLLALSYGPAKNKNLELFHLSVIDSISPTSSELRYPGPLLEYSYPRGELKNSSIRSGLSAMMRQDDAEAAQVLIEREFLILQQYANTPLLKDAWVRYYRLIYRDSFDRIKNAAEAVTRKFGGHSNMNDDQKRKFAQQVLSFTQSFEYERNLNGSDFVNLVTAVTEGRGDCDNRAMLFAIILNGVNIPAAIMVSPHYSHAMGLADLKGEGARFESSGKNWLVAETTANIDIGLIAQDQSDPKHWFSVVFE